MNVELLTQAFSEEEWLVKFDGTKYVPFFRVRDRLNQAIGVGKWGYEKTETLQFESGVSVTVVLHIEGCDLPFTGTGDASYIVDKKGKCNYEQAVKNATSDAIKKAANICLGVPCIADNDGSNFQRNNNYQQRNNNYNNNQGNYQNNQGNQQQGQMHNCRLCGKPTPEKIFNFRNLGLCMDCQKTNQTTHTSTTQY